MATFDPFLNPGFLVGLLNMHKLDTDGRAVGPLDDGEDFSNAACFETEDVIEKNLTVPVFFREAICSRVQLRMLFRYFKAERIEVGPQMPSYAIGPDQHQGADRINGGSPYINLRGTGFFRLLRCAVGCIPENFILIFRLQSIGRCPGSPAGFGDNGFYIITKGLEILAPTVINGIGIVEIARVKVLHKSGVGSKEERRIIQLLRHFK